VTSNPVPPNVLVVRFSSIGDVLLITPLLRALRRRHPASRITVLTKRIHAPLIDDNPNANEVIALEPGDSLPPVASRIRSAGYTHLLDLHDNLRSRVLRALAPGPWRRYPMYRAARALLIHAKRDRYPVRRPVAERYFAAARGLDVHPDGEPPEFFLGPRAENEAAVWEQETGLGTHRPLVAVAPGAAHATKRWPTEHWRVLVDRIVDSGMDVAVVGGPADQPIAEAVAAGRGERSQSAAGLFGVQATGAILRRARALVSGDTGVMHMATGVGTPVVALFGPTVEAFGFFPYTRRAEVVQLDLACRPCSSHGGPVCPLGHHHCLTLVEPEMVYAALCRSVA
jgi:lipopolysaccharide heptosyltransferase II